MNNSPITNLLEWLVDEKIITKDQSAQISMPLMVTIKNYYDQKDVKANIVPADQDYPFQSCGYNVSVKDGVLDSVEKFPKD